MGLRSPSWIIVGSLAALACSSKTGEPARGGAGGSGGAPGGTAGTPMSAGGTAAGARGGSSGASGSTGNGSGGSSGSAGASAGTSGSSGEPPSGGRGGTAGSMSAGGAGAMSGAGGAGAMSGAGGTMSAGGAVGACPGSCTSEPSGSCATPEVRISSVDLGGALSYSTDETAAIPLAIAAKPGGGSRLAWVTGYSRYGSSTASQVHIGELDCDDALTGTPFALEGHDFQDLAADADGGVIVLTKDAEGSEEQHCGDVNNLCILPNDRPGCYDTYMLRYDCAGQVRWTTKLTSSSEATPPYASGGGQNMFVWWYQHHGRLAYDGTNYAAYFCDAITVTNDQCVNGAGKVDIHEGDRMQVVAPDGSLVKGHDSFGLGCSHSWTTRIVWDPRTSHFVMTCATDNDCRIAQPNPYRTIVAGDCDGTLFGGDVVNAGDTGYWTAWSQGGVIKLEHFTTGASDKTVTTAGDTKYPHLVAYGASHMLLTWGAGSGLAAQVYDSTTGEPVGDQFSIAVPDHPWQSWKPFPDGSVAFASVGSASSTVEVARVLPCAD
ncbi:MAG TPA: hypothetical protein VFV94_18295 [Polyangiaceae bacterium]|nr:hypothetical protein [Polyangiaceae bacterium]